MRVCLRTVSRGTRCTFLHLALAACAAFGVPSPAAAQSAQNVLLVINENSPVSVEVGSHYASVRQLPTRNIVRIQAADQDGVSWTEFEATIQTPIAKWLSRHLLQDQILFIVLTKGVPLRVDGTGGPEGTVASVDSELTLLYRRMAGTTTTPVGRIDNPYFLGDKAASEALRFDRARSDLYLVTRLDGFTVSDIKALIDRGAKPSTTGKIVLDQKSTSGDRSGDSWLAETASRLKSGPHGDRVLLESTRALAATDGPVLGYFSWGSNDPANQLRKFGLSFVPGAIGGMFVSTDARTFREPHPDWKPAPAGSTTGGQTLIGDLIREGITGVSGHVSEPYLDAMIRPQILYPTYLAGFSLAESFYVAMPFLSWQDVVIGDPLCAPFAGPLKTLAPIAIDDETGLPKFFAERALAGLAGSGFKLDALKLMLRGNSLLAQERPQSEVRPLLERAASADPRMTAVQLTLAELADSRGDVDEMLARYRAVLGVDGKNVVALNNLAYALAERRKQFDQALPLAERALALAPESPTVADTVGWIHFLRGDFEKAKSLMDRALAGGPDSVDILIHASAVAVALKDIAEARSLLDRAVKVDPKAADRADVKALREKIRLP